MTYQVTVDLHGYHPRDVNIAELVSAAWEYGAGRLEIIHGHGRNRGISVGFVNTNTGYSGLTVWRALKNDKDLRKWIYYSTVDCGNAGLTEVPPLWWTVWRLG